MRAVGFELALRCPREGDGATTAARFHGLGLELFDQQFADQSTMPPLHRRAVDVLKAPIKAETASTLTHNGETVALITWERIPYDEGTAVLATAFMATERFFPPDVPSVRFGRRFLRELQADTSNLPIVSYSWSQHPKTERGYRLIGYELYEVDGLCRGFVLQPHVAQP